jgi:lipopolysaccharide biosynthesis glycosyltransferase
MRSPPYGRLVFPEVLPAGIRKLIYLDVDLIVLSSLRDLYTKDLAGNTIAAAKDRAGTVDCSWAGIPNYEALGIPGKTPYFNSGVMLIDVARWRADRVSERVLDVTRQNREHVRWHDQYGLNVVLRGAWEELDPSWNHFDGILPSTRVFHYLSSKPIFHDYKGAHGDLFFRYLDQTAWAGWRPRREPRQFRLLKERIVRKVLIPLGF